MIKKRVLSGVICLLVLLTVLLSGCEFINPAPEPIIPINLDEIPEFSGEPFVYINGNVPYFTEEEIVTKSYESYSSLDKLGRCSVAMSCVGTDLKPTVDREDTESISGVKPSGWKNKNYGDLVENGWLYNRCHLIGWQLTGETDNKSNLITGTRFMNVEGMLPFENMIADYLRNEPDNHVMYRVTPIFKGEELVARGVLLEAYSVEDKGEEISFCVYVYNNQPGIIIDYATGDSGLDGEYTPPEADGGDENGGNEETTKEYYFLNTKSGTFHRESCRYASGENCVKVEKTKEELVADNKKPCGTCKP